MSSQNPASNHCSRTYWTTTMERYFIDLMLEHIHRGNRIGHTFNKQTWTDMLAVFNAKFGSQYDKDVLKIRYTNLWKQFNDIKNLLDQNGFSWDETRQMVVASDDVWDAYLKIHPEARPYKTKLVLNFDDLCLIYGYTIADGRYSRSSHDVDVEDEIQGVHFANGNTSLAPSSSSRTEWTQDMDQYFIELMLKQHDRGNKLGNTFTKQAWTDMLTLFNAKFGSEYKKRVLRHRYKKLWKYYSDLMALVKQKGFCWAEKQKMVVADDDVWDAYIKAHPHARSYRSKVFPSYYNLGVIFGGISIEESQRDFHQDKDTKYDAVVGRTGNERPRTYWTPPMDRFLIDLMLEQVHYGNQIGQSFITQAWNGMVASFNANFNSHHDREVLKNRYKHFRKQYNDVNILLQHIGFSWDEDREMVTAEDHVWDAYIKEHPDARSYRIKTVPCYHKLCIIYGQEKFDGSYGHLIDNIDSTVENPCTMIGSRKEDSSATAANPVVEWTLPMEQNFIELVLEQVHHGNKIEGTLDEQAWAQITVLLKEKFGIQYEQRILKNHYLSLMKQFIEIRDLLNQKGFLWDESLKMIAADHDTWESYIKEHPNAILYQDKILRHYNDLCIIFGTAGLSCELGMEFDQHTTDSKIDVYSGDLPVAILETETFDQGRKRPQATPLSLERCSKVQKTHKKKGGVFTNIDSIVAKLGSKKEAGNNYVSIENAIDALQAIPDMDDELLLDGCDLLEDEKKAKTFLALDATLRKKWLLRKLGRT